MRFLQCLKATRFLQTLSQLSKALQEKEWQQIGARSCAWSTNYANAVMLNSSEKEQPNRSSSMKTTASSSITKCWKSRSSFQWKNNTAFTLFVASRRPSLSVARESSQNNTITSWKMWFTVWRQLLPLEAFEYDCTSTNCGRSAQLTYFELLYHLLAHLYNISGCQQPWFKC